MSLTKPGDLLVQLEKNGLVPVVSLPSVEAGLRLSEVLIKCGLPVVEITFRTAFGAGGMAAIRKAYPQMLLLAGTILTPLQVDEAQASGAEAIVTPGFSPGLAAYCRERSLPFFPGVCTPSEAQTAMEVGCTSLKFFPAENMGGVKMLSLFKALYPDIRFMPTGGINLDNIRAYLALDNVLCCGGTWLCPEQLMKEGRWDEIESRVNIALEAIKG